MRVAVRTDQPTGTDGPSDELDQRVGPHNQATPGPPRIAERNHRTGGLAPVRVSDLLK